MTILTSWDTTSSKEMFKKDKKDKTGKKDKRKPFVARRDAPGGPKKGK
jgi:hypothetical protein